MDFVPVDGYGTVDLDAYEQAFRADTRLASVMFANNVIGTIQPVAELARIAHEHGAAFHTDAVQAVGSLPVDVKALGVDMLSLSGHKLYGPKGIGALYVKRGTRLSPIMHGGGHERRLRSGTENVPGIVGLAAALDMATEAMPDQAPSWPALRDRCAEGVVAGVPDVLYLGHPTERLPGNVAFTVRFIEGESMLLSLDAKGIMVSSGSACASGSLEPQHVILGTRSRRRGGARQHASQLGPREHRGRGGHVPARLPAHRREAAADESALRERVTHVHRPGDGPLQ